jgi:hypothetical protein
VTKEDVITYMSLPSIYPLLFRRIISIKPIDKIKQTWLSSKFIVQHIFNPDYPLRYEMLPRHIPNSYAGIGPARARALLSRMEYPGDLNP